jgi:hypothetical protein
LLLLTAQLLVLAPLPPHRWHPFPCQHELDILHSHRTQFAYHGGRERVSPGTQHEHLPQAVTVTIIIQRHASERTGTGSSTASVVSSNTNTNTTINTLSIFIELPV